MHKILQLVLTKLHLDSKFEEHRKKNFSVSTTVKVSNQMLVCKSYVNKLHFCYVTCKKFVVFKFGFDVQPYSITH